MKNHMLRASSIVVLLTAMVAASFVCFAQQERARPQEPAQEKQPLELSVMQQSELLPVGVPKACAGIKPVVEMHDVADNFKSPGNPITLSPALATWLSSNNLKPKGYDDPRVNMPFADSFKLKSCKVCYATLQVNVRHYGDIWTNDWLYAGAAPFGSFPERLLATPIWPNGPHTYALSTSGLNQLIWSTKGFDVYAQDDSDFDFMTLSVWYF